MFWISHSMKSYSGLYDLIQALKKQEHFWVLLKLEVRLCSLNYGKFCVKKVIKYVEKCSFW